MPWTLLTLVALLLCLFVAGSFKEREHLLEAEKYPLVSQYKGSTVAHARIGKVAVFLLASISNAVELGEEVPDHEYTNYYSRLLAAKATWASHVDHFYGVTGAGPAEIRVFNSQPSSSAKSMCVNISKTYLVDDRHVDLSNNGSNKREIFECKNSSMNVRILHLPQCDGSNFGARGPCCRCNEAMKFFLDLHSLLKSSSSSLMQEGGGKSQYHRHPPDWFIFADDDYFLRMHYIETVLSNYPAKKAYAIKLWGNGDVAARINKDSISQSDIPHQGREGMGMSIYNSNCTQPCAHRMHWMGFGGFSIGAMHELSRQIRADALVKVCDRLSLTHDVGLGMFTWMNSIDTVRFIEHIDVIKNIHNVPSPQALLFETALTHNHEHKSYSELFHRTLLKTHPEGTTTLNIDKYIQHEMELGMMTYELLLPYHYRGYKNTIFYRKQQVLEAILDGIFVNASSLSAIKKDLPHILENTDYTFNDCNDDAQSFHKWLTSLNTTVAKFSSEASMCLLYSLHISNSPAFDKAEFDAILRMGDTLLRRRRRRRRK